MNENEMMGRLIALEAKLKALYGATEDVVKAADRKFDEIKRRLNELESTPVANNVGWLVPKPN